MPCNTYLCWWDTTHLQDLEQDKWIGAAVVLDNIDVRINAKHVAECCRKCRLVDLVTLVANRVDERPVHICVEMQTMDAFPFVHVCCGMHVWGVEHDCIPVR